MKYMKLKYQLIALIAGFFVVLSGCADATTTQSLNRVAIVGASVTAGFGVKTPPVDGDAGDYRITMKHIWEGMIDCNHDEVGYFGEMIFFGDPKAAGKESIDKTIAYNPTLVIGIDFLFWFGYGTPPKNVDPKVNRIEKLQYAFDLLDSLDAQIIVGDLPDVHGAIGKMLSPAQVPSVDTLNKLNTMIYAWAKDRPNITVVSVRNLAANLMNDEEITYLGYTWPAGSQEELLQKDMLHTTLEGTIAASLMLAEKIQTQCLETDPNVIKNRALERAREEKITSLF